MILFAIGTRPNIIKLRPLVYAAEKFQMPYTVYDTGQHYDKEMQGNLYRELDFPPWIPHSKSFDKDTSFEHFLKNHEPDIVVVIGDTNSTVDCAVTASRVGFPVAHVEAGCRCGVNIPEEVNRKIVDTIAVLNFAATARCMENLDVKTRHCTGDVLYDMFVKNTPDYTNRHSNMALVTIHRQENTASYDMVYEKLAKISDMYDIVLFPVHPRIKGMLRFPSHVIPLPPQGYRRMLYLISLVRHVYTDSGGVQREAYWSGTPFTLLRGETEWPETMKPGNEHEFGEGHAAEKIMTIIKEWL